MKGQSPVGTAPSPRSTGTPASGNAWTASERCPPLACNHRQPALVASQATRTAGTSSALVDGDAQLRAVVLQAFHVDLGLVLHRLLNVVHQMAQVVARRVHCHRGSWLASDHNAITHHTRGIPSEAPSRPGIHIVFTLRPCWSVTWRDRFCGPHHHTWSRLETTARRAHIEVVAYGNSLGDDRLAIQGPRDLVSLRDEERHLRAKVRLLLTHTHTRRECMGAAQ